MDLREQRGTLVFRQIHLTDEELHRSKLAVAEPTV